MPLIKILNCTLIVFKSLRLTYWTVDQQNRRTFQSVHRSVGQWFSSQENMPLLATYHSANLICWSLSHLFIICCEIKESNTGSKFKKTDVLVHTVKKFILSYVQNAYLVTRRLLELW